MTDAPALEHDNELSAPIADGVQVDLRLAFLARAAAKFYLVENGLEDLDQAFADLHHAIHTIAPCPCEQSTLDGWKRLDRAAPIARQARRWEAPASTYEAALYALRTRGIAAFAEPRLRQRLAELSADQMRELVAALTRLRPQCPSISEALMSELGKRIR